MAIVATSAIVAATIIITAMMIVTITTVASSRVTDQSRSGYTRDGEAGIHRLDGASLRIVSGHATGTNTHDSGQRDHRTQK